MSPRTFVARSAAIVSLAALGLAACESKTIVQPPVIPLSISVSPATVTLKAAGQKAQFVAVVTGPSDAVTTYTWSSSNTAVATVDANGVVTAVANGTSSIIATATADATKKAAGVVTVDIPVVVPPVTTPATISIQSVTNNFGFNVPLGNVAGQINVNLNVDPGTGNNIAKVEVLVDGNSACSQTFSSTSAQVGVEATDASVISCSINTAQLKADGTPLYVNGPHTITARLVAGNGSVVANPVTETFTLNNVNALNLAVTPGKTVTNPNNGQAFAGHGLTVVVTPAIFGLTGNVTDMTVSVGYASMTKTITSNTAPQTFVFTDSALAGIEGVTSITASSNLSTGFAGPSSPNPVVQLQIDERGPAQSVSWTGLGGNPAWLNATSTLSLSALGLSSLDGGVDNNVDTLQVSPNTSTKTWTVAPATAVAMGQQASRSMVLRLKSCDALNNCSTSTLSNPFGVDLAPPKIILAGDTLNKINPATAAFNIIAADTGTVGVTVISGAPTNLLGIKVAVYTPTGNFCADSTGATVAAMPSTGCAAIAAPTNTNVTLPAAGVKMGYDSVVVTAQDSAGNVTTASTKLYLVDTQAPTMGGITFPASVTGGSSVTFSTSAADNIDLGAWSATEAFGAGFALQVGSGTLGTFGKDVFTTTGTPTVVANPFIVSVQMDTAGAVTKATGVGFALADVAGNNATPNALDITATITDPGTFSFKDSAKISGWAMTATPAALNLDGAPGPKTSTLKATAIVKTGAAQPFSSVIFYARLTGVGAYIQVGTAGAGFGTENIINKTFDYSATWTPTVVGTYDVIAVALDAKGHALVSPIVAVTVGS